MRVFLTKKGDEYNEYIREYEEHLPNFFQKLEKAHESYPEAVKNKEYNDYVIYHNWPIRKLEYSYVISQIKKKEIENKKVLEAGCGVSPMPFLWANYGADVTAIDLSDKSIELMKKFNYDDYFGIGANKIHFDLGNLADLPYEDNTFDIIETISVLEHIPFPSYLKALSEMYRVLKPNGTLVCTCDVKSGSEMKTGWIGAFSTQDIQDFLGVFNNELQKGDVGLDKLEVSQEQIIEFWNSHYTENCGYFENRDYGAVGFTIEKIAGKTKKEYLLSEELFINKTIEMMKQYETLYDELEKKEEQIQLLAKAAQERYEELENKEKQIQLLKKQQLKDIEK